MKIYFYFCKVLIKTDMRISNKLLLNDFVKGTQGR